MSLSDLVKFVVKELEKINCSKSNFIHVLELHYKSPDCLSPRELQIIKLLAHGKSNKEVATELNLSVRTVDSHRHSIYKRLGFSRISNLIHYAVIYKLIDLNQERVQ